MLSKVEDLRKKYKWRWEEEEEGFFFDGGNSNSVFLHRFEESFGSGFFRWLVSRKKRSNWHQFFFYTDSQENTHFFAPLFFFLSPEPPINYLFNFLYTVQRMENFFLSLARFARKRTHRDRIVFVFFFPSLSSPCRMRSLLALTVASLLINHHYKKDFFGEITGSILLCFFEYLRAEFSCLNCHLLVW